MGFLPPAFLHELFCSMIHRMVVAQCHSSMSQQTSVPRSLGSYSSKLQNKHNHTEHLGNGNGNKLSVNSSVNKLNFASSCLEAA